MTRKTSTPAEQPTLLGIADKDADHPILDAETTTPRPAAQDVPRKEVKVADPKRTTAVAVQTYTPPTVQASGSGEILSIIAKAAGDSKTNVEKMRALLDMQKEIMAIQARANFDAAFADMQGELPSIDKKGRIEIREKDSKGNRTGDVQQSSPYAKFEDINEACRPILKRYGFGVRFVTGLDSQGRVRVVGVLSGHGHREEAEFILPHDSSGSKNAVQAIGSSFSYGKRYALIALLNITVAGQDDDGKAGGGIPLEIRMSDIQIDNLRRMIETVGCGEDAFVDFMNSAYGGKKGIPVIGKLTDIPGKLYDESMRQLLNFDRNKNKPTDVKPKA